MENNKNSTAEAGEHPDDLEIIDGIGPVYSEALHQIGVHRFADLAQWTPLDLLRTLHEETGTHVRFERIESDNWIGQAQMLADQAEHDAEPAELGAASAEDGVQPGNDPDWRQQASFSLTFDSAASENGERRWRTRAYHDECNEEVSFSGVDPMSWVDWILDRAQLPRTEQTEPSEPQEALAEPIPPGPITGSWSRSVAQETARLEIGHVELSEVAREPGERDKKLVADVEFELLRTDAETLVNDLLPTRVEAHMVDLDTLQAHLVAAVEHQLQSETPEATCRLEFAMPEVGRYQLNTIVLSLPPADVMYAHARGPTINIVP